MSTNRRNFRITFTVSIVLLLAIAVFVTSILSKIPGAHLDLTSDKLFTMSPSAAKILGELQVPVQVKLYITPENEMPTELKNLGRDVLDKLRDYERVSGGKLQFAIYNPQDNEEIQNDLIAKGIRPFQIQSIQRDEINVKQVWSAMTIVYKDYPEEIIPQILPRSLSNLEYELVSRVYRLTHEEKPKVALYAPPQQVNQQLAMMYLQQGMQPPAPQDIYTNVKQLLAGEHYEVVSIDLTEDSRIPADASVLMVLNPANLDERQVFEINRALSNGLPTIIAVQSHTYDYSPAARGGFTFSAVGQESGLEEMLAKFGVSVVTDHFFDMSLQVLDVPRQANIGGIRFQTREPVRAPIQILVTESQMSSEAALTNRIGSLLYLWGTPLTLNTSTLAQENLAVTTLITSSNRCWQEPYNDGALPGSFLNSHNKEFIGPQPLAIILEGEFPDSFQGRALPAWPKVQTASTEEAEAADEELDTAPPLAPAATQLVLYGSAKMFDDVVIGGGQNALLLLNSVDALAHGEDLISIRAKMLTQRVIKPVGDGEKFIHRLSGVFLVPVILTIFGIARAAMRRKEATLYRQQLAHSSRSRA